MATDKETIDSLKRDWSATDYYNFEDLNRVEKATEAVSNQVIALYGEVLAITILTNRTESTIEFADDLNRVENNIYLLKQTFPNPEAYQNSKTNWTYNSSFSFLDANRLEGSLYDMWYHVENNITNRPYCGQFTTGQEGVY